jgi:two-component system cell cycle response regulator DivK
MNDQRSVLLVEDIESTIDVVSMELKSLGYSVTVARTGLEALDRLAEHMPNLVIMDIQLPQMGGFEAVRRIRDNPAMRDVAILAATAKALAGDKEACLAAGCDGYIAKPFTHKQLDFAINAMFKRRLGDDSGQTER